MTVGQLTQQPVASYGYDPLRDSRHRSARAAREVEDWLRWQKLRNLAPRTLDRRERSAAVLLNMFPNTPVDEFTEADILHYLTGYPQKSLRHRRGDIKQFFDYCAVMGLANLDFRKIPNPKPEGQRVVPTFSEAAVELLCALPDPDGPLMEILFFTGLRKSEAIALLRRHVNLEEKHLVVYRGKGSKGRVVPLFSRTVKKLAGWFLFDGINDRDHLWYSTPGGGRAMSRRKEIGPTTFHDWWVRCIAAAGVDYLNPHAARHTYANFRLRRHGRMHTLSKDMGHSSIAITVDTYGHMDLEDSREDIALIEAQF